MRRQRPFVPSDLHRMPVATQLSSPTLFSSGWCRHTASSTALGPQRKAGSRNPIKPNCGSGPLLAGSDSEERASPGLENQIGADSPVIAGGMSTLLPALPSAGQRRPRGIFPRSLRLPVAVTEGSVTRNSNEIGVGSGPIRPKVGDSDLVGTRRFSSSGQSKFANTSQRHRSNLTADQPHKRTDKGGVRCGQAQRRCLSA